MLLNSFIMGLPPRMKGLCRPLPAVVLHHNSCFFLPSWPRCQSAAAGCTYTGGVATVPPLGRSQCRNGEVWTSPRRESFRLPDRSQRSGGTSSPKADGLYK